MQENKTRLTLDALCWQTGGTVILEDVSFSLRAGECAFITGPSGCGKSTLLKIIGALISPSRGQILLDDKSMDDFTPEAWRQAVSYCAQTPALFGDTVYDNLAFPWLIRKKTPDVTKMRADLARVALSADMLEKGITELSGGEKQRISLIRNLQFIPQVLLLDEITSALDETNKRNVNGLIRQIAAEHNVSVLWVTHDSNEIHPQDRVIALDTLAGRHTEQHHEPA